MPALEAQGGEHWPGVAYVSPAAMVPAGCRALEVGTVLGGGSEMNCLTRYANMLMPGIFLNTCDVNFNGGWLMLAALPCRGYSFSSFLSKNVFFEETSPLATLRSCNLLVLAFLLTSFSTRRLQLRWTFLCFLRFAFCICSGGF